MGISLGKGDARFSREIPVFEEMGINQALASMATERDRWKRERGREGERERERTSIGLFTLCSAGAPRIHHPMGSNGEHHAPAERKIYGIAQRRRGCLAHATTKVRAPFNARTPDER